jgi:hypothetical protein
MLNRHLHGHIHRCELDAEGHIRELHTILQCRGQGYSVKAYPPPFPLSRAPHSPRLSPGSGWYRERRKDDSSSGIVRYFRVR